MSIHDDPTQIITSPPAPPGRAEAANDMLAWASLIAGFVFWPLGLLFGHVSNRAAKRARRRRSVLSIVGLTASYLWLVVTAGLIIGLAAGSSSAGTGISAAPAPPATSAPASPGTGNHPNPATDDPAWTPPPAAGPDKLRAGDTEMLAGTAGGSSVGMVTVGHPVVTTYPADPTYGSKPAHGYYVIVKVTAKADAANTDGWFVSPLDFHAVVKGQHFDEDNGNAYQALSDAQSGSDLSATLAAGETVNGYIAFDVPSAHGKIVYAPNYDGQPVAEWSY